LWISVLAADILDLMMSDLGSSVLRYPQLFAVFISDLKLR
jgi:hypothetical protein